MFFTGDVISVAGMEGDRLQLFLMSLGVMAVSIWFLFLNPRVPVPGRAPGVIRFLLEFTNDWLLIWATPAGCFFLPISSVLALACLEGGLAFWHWPVAVAMFAALLVWRLR